jgi:hypothetical protein
VSDCLNVNYFLNLAPPRQRLPAITDNYLNVQQDILGLISSL